jgi:hypothetical protein
MAHPRECWHLPSVATAHHQWANVILLQGKEIVPHNPPNRQ